MNILGINFSHDASVVLIREGKLITAIEEEKINRVKQAHGWPTEAVRTVLKQQGLVPKDIDVLAFGSNFYAEVGKHELLHRFFKHKWYRYRELADRVAAYFGLGKHPVSQTNRPVFESALRQLGFSRAKIHYYGHHTSHATSAWYAAPFESDLVITADGHGEGEAFNFYKFEPQKGLICIRSNNYECSVGQFYSCITGLLGFRPNRHEGKITGLAAFGKHSPLLERFASLFYYENESLRRKPGPDTEAWWNEFGIHKKQGWKTKVNLQTSESPIGEHYARNAAALTEWLRRETAGYSQEDIAFACQQVTESVILEETQRVLAEHFPGQKVKVALAGGVFANVRVNQKIYELNSVENIFVQPAMGDAGLALGAAIQADITLSNTPHDTDQYRFLDTYIGSDFSDGLNDFIKIASEKFEVRKMENPAQEIAEMMQANQIIGFWHGPMEWGPRALGHRSIILNTFDRTVNQSLNVRLGRTDFMPFAPSVIDYMAEIYMPDFDKFCPAGEYMTVTYDVAPEYHELLQAVVHVDGTARPQLVRQETNPYYYDILDAFYKLTGCGAIVNTSFNVHEEPIVSTPAVALRALEQGRVDCLVLENYCIRRH